MASSNTGDTSTAASVKTWRKSIRRPRSKRIQSESKTLAKPCYGGVVTGLLGFFALFPVDYLMGDAIVSLAGTGPVGVILDLIVLAPVELMVIDLHLAFISLAYHSTGTQCKDLELRSNLFPPWGFGK